MSGAATIEELVERIELLEKNYGMRVETFIRDTEHLAGRIERLEKRIAELEKKA